jgi:NAD+ kinase
MQPFRRLAFVVNPDKPGAAELAQELMEIAGRVGVKKVKLNKGRKLPRGYFRGCDACCVVGGDGTLLGVGRAPTSARCCAATTGSPRAPCSTARPGPAAAISR